MLEAAQVENVFADRPRYPTLSDADLQAAAPDVVLLSSEPFPFRAAHIADLEQLLPFAKVLLVDGEMFSWYGSRLLAAADYLREIRLEMLR